MTDEVPTTDAMKAMRRKQKLVLAAHRTLNSEDGKILIEGLEREFPTRLPRFRQRTGGSYDPIHAAILDGQCSVVTWLYHLLEQTPEDAHSVKEKVTVKK